MAIALTGKKRALTSVIRSLIALPGELLLFLVSFLFHEIMKENSVNYRVSHANEIDKEK